MNPELSSTMDVTHVTRRFSPSWLERNASALRKISSDRIIIDESTPLGMARVRAISRVRTPYFVDVDDDVVISHDWFVNMVRAWREQNGRLLLGYTAGSRKGSGGWYPAKIGAINCTRYARGLGRRFDESLNRHVSEVFTHDLRHGERGGTGCTMFLTEAVKDWRPSVPDLSAFEDYEISQYVLMHGYRWIILSAKEAECWHELTWKHVRDNAVWGSHGWKKVHIPTFMKIMHEIASVFFLPFVCLVQERSVYLFMFLLYQSFFRIVGLVW